MRAPGVARGEKPGEEHVSRPDRRDRFDTWGDCPEPARVAILAQQRDAAELRRDEDVARAHLGEGLEPDAEVFVVVELLPDQRLGLALVRRDEERLRLDGEPQGLAFAVDHGEDVTARQVAHGLGVEVVGDVPGQRAGEHDELLALRQVAQLLEQQVELVGVHCGPPLVDLGVRAARWVDHGGGRPRLALDVHEVVEDRFVGQLLDDARARLAAHEAGRDHGHAERLERAGDVDALAAGERDARACAMALPTLEVGHGQRPVDRRVECDSDDHGLEEVGEVVQGPAGVPP